LEIPVRVFGFNRVTSIQFSLEWDPARLDFTGVDHFRLPGLGWGHFGTARALLGRLSFSWDDSQGRAITLPDGAELFSVQFRPRGDGGVGLRFSDDPPGREVSVDLRIARFEAVDFGGADSGRSDPAIAFAGFETLESGNVFSFSFATRAGADYVVEFTDDLITAAWETLAELNGDGNVQTVRDRREHGRQRFYRVRIR
jgi:hypothetical protein